MSEEKTVILLKESLVIVKPHLLCIKRLKA